MTEADWLAATDPELLLSFFWSHWTERKRRLFEVACCRYVWHMLVDERSRRAVAAAEDHADGLLTDAALDTAANSACEAQDHEFSQLTGSDQEMLSRYGVVDPPLVCSAAYNVAVPMEWWGSAPAFEATSRITRGARGVPPGQAGAQCDLLRDIVGNPFRPVALDPAWRTEAVVGLAAGIYADRAFDRLPVLADALEDAGCADPDILSHCRGPGPHVRGCWAVDLLLGKS